MRLCNLSSSLKPTLPFCFACLSLGWRFSKGWLSKRLCGICSTRLALARQNGCANWRPSCPCSLPSLKTTRFCGYATSPMLTKFLPTGLTLTLTTSLGFWTNWIWWEWVMTSCAGSTKTFLTRQSEGLWANFTPTRKSPMRSWKQQVLTANLTVFWWT